MANKEEQPDAKKHYLLVSVNNEIKQFGIIVSADEARINSWSSDLTIPHETFFAGSANTANRTKKILFATLIACGYVPFNKKK